MCFCLIYKTIDPDRTLCYAWFESMHTRIDIMVCNQTEDQCRSLLEKIHQEIQEIEQAANRFDPHSELSLLNREASSRPVKVSRRLGDMIRECCLFYEQTEGCFDVTIHSLDGYRKGIEGIVCDESDQSIFYRHPAIQIDLGGYAKGAALERCRRMILEAGVKHALINFGNSSVCALGNHPFGEGWKIALPKTKDREERSVVLHDECLSTSGNSAGRLHILSPLDGKPVPADDPVSILTEDARTGEVFSTALCVSRYTGREFFTTFVPIL